MRAARTAPPPGPAPALTSVGRDKDKLWAQIVMHQKNR